SVYTYLILRCSPPLRAKCHFYLTRYLLIIQIGKETMIIGIIIIGKYIAISSFLKGVLNTIRNRTYGFSITQRPCHFFLLGKIIVTCYLRRIQAILYQGIATP